MSTPVRTVALETTLGEARSQMHRYGHGALPVVNQEGKLLGLIARRDLDIAIHHGLGDERVADHLTTDIVTAQVNEPLEVLHQKFVVRNIGRLPVLDYEKLVGIITRSDLVRGLFQETELSENFSTPLQNYFATSAWGHLQQLATLAEEQKIQLYLVGGGVRDLMLNRPNLDLDLVAEGDAGAAIRLGKALQQKDPQIKLQIFEKYQTIAIRWVDDLAVDIATARTETYEKPGVNPNVEHASLQQDLYRRDFTINAMAIALNGSCPGQLIDHFGGKQDLETRIVRAIHPNSFIEDPTRIFRSIRFATRLNFSLAAQTEQFIRRSVKNGLHDGIGGDRLKTEVIYILKAPYWLSALEKLADLDALRCIHSGLKLTDLLKKQLKMLDDAANKLTNLKVASWQLRFERLLLDADLTILEKFYLEAQALERIRLTHENLSILEKLSEQDLDIRALHQLCQKLSNEVCLLLGSAVSPSVQTSLYAYLERRMQLVPLLNGNDLQTLGFKPGPQLREMLAALFTEQLVGNLIDRITAIAWIREHFP
jgi:tRNA nucleotidyltransferase (CCA-adding enzyme)